jgi:hypothetical protein
VAQVVEGQQDVRDHQREQRQPELVVGTGADRRLRDPGEVVAEQAHRPARERRQARQRREAVAVELRLDRGEGIGARERLAVDLEASAGLEADHPAGPHA